jgi:hypothetical protein
MKIYAKSIGMVVMTIVSGIVAALTDDKVTTVEWINVALLAFAAAQVFTAPNVPGAKYTKTFLAVLTAAATAVVSFLSNGVTTAEWLQVLVAAAAAVGVYALPKSGAYPD